MNNPAPAPAADILEQRDTWRVLWQAVTSDGLLALLCCAVALPLAAAFVLPQMPAEGAADPLAYSQWQTGARDLTGAFYSTLTNLGLFSVYQTPWLRIVLSMTAVIVIVRLLDRAARLVSARHVGDAVRDEERLRVTDSAPGLDAVAVYLRGQHYRVIGPQAISPGDRCWLSADRAPWAEIFSLVLHAGLLIAATGGLLDATLGWAVARQQIDTNVSASLQKGNIAVQLLSVDSSQNRVAVKLSGQDPVVTLPLGQPVPVGSPRGLLPCCLTFRLTEITPGFRISATDAGGKPLTITVSSYAGPTQQAVLTFRRDEPARLIAVEEAGLGLLLSEDQGGRVRAYAVPSGAILTDTLIRPTIAISDTTLIFTPSVGAAVAAQYQPGDPLLWVGCVLLLMGFIATRLVPMQRILVRHQGHWTEFYASGQGVRRTVRAVLRQPAANSEEPAAPVST